MIELLGYKLGSASATLGLSTAGTLVMGFLFWRTKNLKDSISKIFTKIEKQKDDLAKLRLELVRDYSTKVENQRHYDDLKDDIKTVNEKLDKLLTRGNG